MVSVANAMHPPRLSPCPPRISASNDLHHDAVRDLRAVCSAVPGLPSLHKHTVSLASVPVNSAITLPVGVVFASYALIARPQRLAQLLAWCEGRRAGTAPFEGVVCLDECHRAKVSCASAPLRAVPPARGAAPATHRIHPFSPIGGGRNGHRYSRPSPPARVAAGAVDLRLGHRSYRAAQHGVPDATRPLGTGYAARSQLSGGR